MLNELLFEFQTPTSKQSKYKEQVSEMRKGRNSGLQKEQKEKHMVQVCLNTVYLLLFFPTMYWIVTMLDHIFPHLNCIIGPSTDSW